MMRRVVICDDAGFIRALLAPLLLSMGFEVVGEASTGAGALLVIREMKPDLVFLDLVLPDLNGLEVLAALRHEGNFCEVIAMTSLDESQFRERAQAVGCAAWLSKPFSKATVKAALDSIYKKEEGLRYG